MNLDIAKGMKAFKSVITANSPVLLTGAAIAGVVATGVLAAKAGYKARGIVDEERMTRVASPEPPFDTFADYYDTFVSQADEVSLQDKAKLTWLCYAAPAVTGISTIASVLGVHIIHTKRHAALAGLYAMTTAKLDDVSEKAEELLGTKKAQQLRDEVSQKALERDEPLNPASVIATGDGTALMKDELSGQWFNSSINKIEAAVNEINSQLVNDDNVCLSDLYDLLGIDSTTLGDKMGWGGPRQMVKAKFGLARTNDGQAVNSVSFHPTPTTDYRTR